MKTSRGQHRFTIPTLLAVLCFLPQSVLGQQKPSIAGEYAGSLGPLRIKLHIAAGSNGVLSCTMDSPDQGAIGIPCDVHLSGSNLSFDVPSVHGTWKGTIGSGGELSGTWSQSNTIALTLTPEHFVPAAKPSGVDGFWLGTLKAGGEIFRIQIIVKSDSAGKEICSLDSLDQHALGVPCANVVFKGDDFSFDVPVIHGHWSGKLSTNGKSLTGTWTQGAPFPLDFTREAKPLHG